MMYYTDASSSRQLSINCGGNSFPGDPKSLPEGNDVALPPNPALEEQAADPNAPHVHVHGHMPGETHEDHMEEGENAEPEERISKETGNGRGRYDDFADKLYNEVMARQGGSTKGGAGSGRNLLNNYYTDSDYTDYGYRPYKDYSDYEYYDVGNQRSRYRNRFGDQRNGGNYGGKQPNSQAHAFFGFDNDDDNTAWGWEKQNQNQQQSRRPVQQNNGVMGGLPRQQSKNRGREGSESGTNLHVQNPNNQFLPRQRAGARQQPPVKPPAFPAKPQTVNTQQQKHQKVQNTKQPPQTPKQGGATPPPSKLYITPEVIVVFVDPSLVRYRSSLHKCWVYG